MQSNLFLMWLEAFTSLRIQPDHCYSIKCKTYGVICHTSEFGSIYLVYYSVKRLATGSNKIIAKTDWKWPAGKKMEWYMKRTFTLSVPIKDEKKKEVWKYKFNLINF